MSIDIKTIACMIMIAVCIPAQAWALSCMPFSAETVAQDDAATVIVARVINTSDGEAVKAGLASDRYYTLRVEQAFKGALKSGDEITVVGKAMGSWGALALKQTSHGYFMVLHRLSPKQVTDIAHDKAAYSFSSCSAVWEWSPQMEQLLSLDRLLRPAPQTAVKP